MRRVRERDSQLIALVVNAIHWGCA